MLSVELKAIVVVCTPLVCSFAVCNYMLFLVKGQNITVYANLSVEHKPKLGISALIFNYGSLTMQTNFAPLTNITRWSRRQLHVNMNDQHVKFHTETTANMFMGCLTQYRYIKISLLKAVND